MRNKLIILFIIITIAFLIKFNLSNRQADSLNKYKIFESSVETEIKKPKSGVVKILVIDGGGMYGILPLYILRYIEQKTKKPIYKQFNLITGSSTGALIATGLTIPDKNKPEKNLLSTDQILYMYNNKIRFQSNLFKKIVTIAGVLSPLYDTDDLKEQIWQYIQEEPLFSELLTNVVIPAYSLYRSTPVIFRSWSRQLNDNNPEYRALDIGIAGASAVPYLSPTHLVSIDSKYSDILIDPLTILPNPGMLALTEAMKLYPKSKYVVLSLGTGNKPINHKLQQKLSLDQLTLNPSFGKIDWVFSSYGITNSGLNWTLDQQLEQFFKTISDRFLHYTRVNINVLPNDYLFPLSTDRQSIKLMNDYGRKMLEQNKAQIDLFINQWLKAN